MSAYLLDGSEVEVIGQLAGMDLSGVVVRRIYGCDGDGEYIDSEPEIVPAVFDSVPSPRMHGDIQQLERIKMELSASIDAMRVQEREIKAALASLDKFSGQLGAIARIADFLEGRITHYLIRGDWGRLSIVAAKKDGGFPYLEDGRAVYGGDTRLLSLFGDAKRNLEWRANQYYDGSGNWITVEPFTSEDAARARFEAIIAKWQDEKEYSWNGLSDAAIKHAIIVPDGLRDALRAIKIKAATGVLDQARIALAAAEKKLQEASL